MFSNLPQSAVPSQRLPDRAS